MREKIDAFQRHVEEVSKNPNFFHHKWFVKWHLLVVRKIALELCDKYPEADRDLVELMVWLHDYGKILDFDHEYSKTLSAGRDKLAELGFPAEFIDRAVSGIEIMDKKLEYDLHTAPIEVQIVSSADGCSHMAGPFLYIFWNEVTDKNFAGKGFEEMMQLNRTKIDKDWQYKIVLPEAKAAFEQRFDLLHEQLGDFPERFIR